MKIKKLLSAILVSAMACTALASCTALTEKSAANGALTYIGLRINPEIEMVTDETGVVVSANAVNNDGEVVLSEVELEGKTAEDAVVEFTETAVDLGYMDVEAGKDTVYVDVNSENAEITEKVEKSLSDKLMKFFEKKGIAGKVSKEVLDTYLAAAEEWNVTPGHAKMIARILAANPELTYDELLNLTVKDLLELLKTNIKNKDVAADLKDNYKDAVKALKDEYKEMFKLREEIEDIEDDLDDEDDLTAEEKAALEAELAEKKAALEALEKEYNEKLDAIKAEFKASSEQAREEHKKEAEERKQAKKDGKKFEDRDDDDDDDDDDRDEKDRDHDDDHDDKKDKDGNENKDNKDGKGEQNGKHHHDDDDDNDDEEDD